MRINDQLFSGLSQVCAVVLIGILSTVAGFYVSDSYREMIMSDNSPYGKILNQGYNLHSIFLALIYCFINAAAAEELLFRGLIAKRMFSLFSFFWEIFFKLLFSS